MSATEASATDGGALSIDQAVELMTAPRDEEEGFEDEPAQGDEAIEPDEEEAEPEDPEAPLAPPHFWSAEDKAAFEALPRHLQETVLSYETNRDNAAARSIQAAAEARNRAEEAASTADQMVERLDKLASEAEAAFGQNWPQAVNWAAVADERGAEQAMRLKLQYDQDLEDMQRLTAAKQEAAEVRHANQTVVEYEKLKHLAPELADPRQGSERRREVVKFLAEHGVPVDQIRHASAVEFALAYDAMRYRRAKSAYAQGKHSWPLAGRAVQPGAGPQRSPSQQRQAGAKARFSQKPTVDNAVAALLARG